MLIVNTKYENLVVVPDKWCPEDTFYLVSWEDVEGAYATACKAFDMTVDRCESIRPRDTGE